MKYKYVFKIFTLIIAFAFLNCGGSFYKAMCGEPEGKQKVFIDSINSKYQNILTITHVPCYGSYMRVNFKTDYRKSLVDSLENSYYKLVNWAEFHVYDKNGKIIRGNTGSM